jgi:hypothetical protein
MPLPWSVTRISMMPPRSVDRNFNALRPLGQTVLRGVVDRDSRSPAPQGRDDDGLEPRGAVHDDLRAILLEALVAEFPPATISSAMGVGSRSSISRSPFPSRLASSSSR